MDSSFAEGLKEFAQFMDVKGYSAPTQQAYAGNLVKFFEWLDGKGIRDVRRVVKDTLQAYMLHLAEAKTARTGQPLGWSSVGVRVRAVKRFFEWLEATQKVLVNPAEVIHEPRRRSRLPKMILTRDEVEKMLEIPNLATPGGIRSRAILEVFYSTGIRLGEMTALQVQDVNFEEGLLRVNEGKGAKDRVVPLGKQAAAFVKAYLSDVRPGLIRQGDKGCLWISNYGTPMSKVLIGLLVSNAGKKAGIGKAVSPHTMRHTFATHMVQNGADVMLVSQLLGHSVLSATQIYVRVAAVDVKRAHEASHPRERDPMEKEETEPVILWKRGVVHD